MKSFAWLALSCLLAFTFQTEQTWGQAVQKKWTMLVFLNGNNNLDEYGDLNIRQMEEVGSTNDVNIVVQWASMKRSSVKRLLIQKRLASADESEVSTSPVVEDMGSVDMGDYRNFVDFVKWGHDNYPADRYFVVVWNHGNGWQLRSMNRSVGGQESIGAMDISYDDKTGSHITTEQLGKAMGEISSHMGRKVELYGSDACLMAMMEVAGEMQNSVNYFVGSEELEPGEGWPYNKFLQRLVAQPDMSGDLVAKALTEEYAAAYSAGGVYGENDATTFSAVDMSVFGEMQNALAQFVNEFQGMNSSDISKVKKVVEKSQKFASQDYVDLLSFMNQLSASSVSKSKRAIDNIKEVYSRFVLLSLNGALYSDATGMSLWLPSNSKAQYNLYQKRYSALKFNQSTNWLSFLKQIN